MPSHREHDAGPPRGILPLESTPGTEPLAWRLTYRYRGDDITLEAAQRVAMTAPPDDSPRTYAARAGTYVTVHDAQGHGIYRQILADPVRSGYEDHSAEGSARARRVTAPSGTFEVVVPDLPDGHDVTLYRLPNASTLVRRAAGSPDVAEPALTSPLVPTDPGESS